MAFDSDKENALEAGCDDFVAKPIQSEILLKEIGEYLK